jgi:glycosyltransferase involved in cell wall biosynthesis
LNPDIVVITGFFNGLDRDYITSIGELEMHYPVVVAISHIPEPWSENHIEYICKQLRRLRKACRILALPPLDKSELVHRFALPEEKIIEGDDYANLDLAQKQSQGKTLVSLLEGIVRDGVSSQHNTAKIESRPRMAYVSPLPPEASGIADYSAELLPALSKYYDIDVIVSQDAIADEWIQENCGVRSVAWFRQNHQDYARVVYHFGNSPFHQHMFDLLSQIPGVVVLHDFFLGDIQFYRESHLKITNVFSNALYYSHGYIALVERGLIKNDSLIVERYPANLEVIRQARGVIVHSEHARELASKFYSQITGEAWRVLPLLRAPHEFNGDRTRAKRLLGFEADDFLVCSFGRIGANKINHTLLDAWELTTLADKANVWLVFVGENPPGPYGEAIIKKINNSGKGRILIAGHVEQEKYRLYLQASDVAVQLRDKSRGETSAAVLDCLNYGIPTIVNANGSLKEIPSNVVIKVPDEIVIYQLVKALDEIVKDPKERQRLSVAARREIEKDHLPNHCARLTADAIEGFYSKSKAGSHAVINALPEISLASLSEWEKLEYSKLIAKNFPISSGSKKLLLDVTITCQDDYKTGIQRVVRALTENLIRSPPIGYRVEPIYLRKDCNELTYCYAREWVCKSLSIPTPASENDRVEFRMGDQLLIIDYTGGDAVCSEQEKIFELIKRSGGSVHFVVYDLLPILMPEFFPVDVGFENWLGTVSRVADSALCISQSVAEDLKDWVEKFKPDRLNPIRIEWFHLGADMDNSIPTRGVPPEAAEVLRQLDNAPSFLMVGTIEPRKGYMQAIEAFSLLWDQGVEVNLVIAGKEGWQALPDDMRRTIPAIIDRLRSHPQRGKRFIWLEGISDEYLDMVYNHSWCLVVASEGEGFGLPLIEAAQRGLPVLARNIPVFREVASEHACYFKGDTPEDLAEAVKAWLPNAQQHQLSAQKNPMPWQTWAQATEQLKARLMLS